VARGTQHRKRRPAPNARVAAPEPKPKAKAKPQHASWEDELFVSRLRVHAKWMFVLLALVFGVGFVIFGVGSGSTGISDVLQNFFRGSSSSGASLSSLEKKTREHPTDAAAWRSLATKLEQKQKDDEAITALTQYTALRPKDESALQELAGIYIRRAGDEQVAYQIAASRTQALAPQSPFQPKANSTLAKALGSISNPLQGAITASTQGAMNDAYTKYAQYGSNAIATYEKVAKLNPNDATTQLRLGQVAQQFGDTQTAKKALTRFLKLAPDDPSAASARKVLKQLK
jgi:Flp pilus assembly protein TadD